MEESGDEGEFDVEGCGEGEEFGEGVGGFGGGGEEVGELKRVLDGGDIPSDIFSNIHYVESVTFLIRIWFRVLENERYHFPPVFHFLAPKFRHVPFLRGGRRDGKIARHEDESREDGPIHPCSLRGTQDRQ